MAGKGRRKQKEIKVIESTKKAGERFYLVKIEGYSDAELDQIEKYGLILEPETDTEIA